MELEVEVEELNGAGWAEKTRRLVTQRLPRPWLRDTDRNGRGRFEKSGQFPKSVQLMSGWTLLGSSKNIGW